MLRSGKLPEHPNHSQVSTLTRYGRCEWGSTMAWDGAPWVDIYTAFHSSWVLIKCLQMARDGEVGSMWQWQYREYPLNRKPVLVSECPLCNPRLFFGILVNVSALLGEPLNIHVCKVTVLARSLCLFLDLPREKVMCTNILSAL